MRVSCVCPTYNRIATLPNLLEEAVESFLRQDYQNKELIIINDHPNQKIIFEHPDVVVINHHKRFATLGEKYNHSIEIASGDYICSWEDDDISLPDRIKTSVEKIGDADYFNPRAYFLLMDGDLTIDGAGYSHNCSMFKKEAWKKVGGYPSSSGPQDAQMDGLLRASCNTVDGFLSPLETFYIYRWGVSNLHLSAFGDTQKVYDEYELSAIIRGEFQLHPKWYSDYVEKKKSLLKEE